MPAPRRPHKNPWPFAIVTFFAVFISSMVCWIVFASRHSMELVSTDYYEEEIQFQKQIDRVSRTAKLSSPALIQFNRKTCVISLMLPPEHSGRSLSGNIHLYRPSDASLDKDFPLEVNGAGSQVIQAANLLPGLWKVQLSWKVDGYEFFAQQGVVIGPN